MKATELIKYSKRLLKGRRIKTTAVCLLPFIAGICLRSAEAAVYCLLLYFGEMKPIELFSGGNAVQLSVWLLCALLRAIAISPLIYAAAFRLSELTGENTGKFTPLSDILMSRRNMRRSFSAALVTRIISFVTLVPAVFLGAVSYRLLMKGGETDSFFMTLNCMVLTVVLSGIWVSVRLTLAAVPFVMAENTDMSIFRTVMKTFKIMHSRKSVLVRLMLIYALPALTAVFLPSAVTNTMTAFSLSISIYQKEDEYAGRTDFHSRYRSSHDFAEFPHRKKRHFTQTSDKTETA